MDAEQIIKLFAKACGPYHYSSFGFPHRKEVGEEIAAGRMRTVSQNGQPVIAYVVKTLKMDSTQRDFRGNDVRVPKGAIFISDIAIADDADESAYAAFAGQVKSEIPIPKKASIFGLGNPDLWIEIYQESPQNCKLVEYLRWRPVAYKVMAGSEIKALYCSSARHALKMDPCDLPVISQIKSGFFDADQLQLVRKELAAYLKQQQKAWENHYSIYNTKDKWAAFALQGFKEDPNFIIKPSEMSKKWKAEHEAEMKLTTPVATEAFDQFPLTIELINELLPAKFERIRFMRLGSEGGILKRHADITDRFAGTADKMVTRLHVPIYTNDKVVVRGWELSGNLTEMKWSVGGLFYLDQRKPHEVVNKSSEDRIHLVVDCYANEHIRQLIRGGTV